MIETTDRPTARSLPPSHRPQALYVYQRQYESGGQMWPLVAHRAVSCCWVMVLFTSAVFVLKGAYTQAALLCVTLPIYLLRFDA